MNRFLFMVSQLIGSCSWFHNESVLVQGFTMNRFLFSVSQ